MTNLLMYQEIKTVFLLDGNLCRANFLKRRTDNQYAIVSLDYLYQDEPSSDVQFKEKNYHELVQEELTHPYLAWFPSLEEALDNF